MLDESHIDGAKLYRPRARCVKGKRTRRLPKPTRAHRFTLLAAMSLDGAMAAKTVTGPVSRPTVEDFFQHDLVSRSLHHIGCLRTLTVLPCPVLHVATCDISLPRGEQRYFNGQCLNTSRR